MSKELFQNATAVAKKSGEMSVALLPLTERLIFEFVERGYSVHVTSRGWSATPGGRRANASRVCRTAAYRKRFKAAGPVNWEETRAAVFERDSHTCQYCGATDNLHCDHVTPLIQGGGHDMGNLITACRACNCGKAGRTPQQWKRRVK